MKIKHFILLSILIVLISCNTSEKERNYNFTDYDYEIRSYSSDSSKPENFRNSKFYRNNTLIKEIGKDYCKRYIYDSSGKLIETIWGRDCDYGRRKIRIYDSRNNHIGFFSTMESIINLDTVKVEQIYFYDSKSRLIKELTDKRKDINGEEYEVWKNYKYLNDKIISEITIIDNDTVWKGKYFYDSIGNLTKIHRATKRISETELFKYNIDNLMIKKEIISNDTIFISNIYNIADTSFCAGKKTRKYFYDSTGFKTQEKFYNNEGKLQVKSIYLKIDKN